MEERLDWGTDDDNDDLLIPPAPTEKSSGCGFLSDLPQSPTSPSPNLLDLPQLSPATSTSPVTSHNFYPDSLQYPPAIPTSPTEQSPHQLEISKTRPEGQNSLNFVDIATLASELSGEDPLHLASPIQACASIPEADVVIDEEPSKKEPIEVDNDTLPQFPVYHVGDWVVIVTEHLSFDYRLLGVVVPFHPHVNDNDADVLYSVLSPCRWPKTPQAEADLE